MKSSRSENQNPAFRWRDMPRAIWYFLEEDRTRFVVYSCILIVIFLYTLVPPYLVGKIVDFFTTYKAGDSLKNFYILSITIGVSFAVASAIRLDAKRVLVNFGHHMRSRARILGFERLTEFSMQWHAQENSGNKIQRIYSGSQALLESMRLFTRNFLNVIVSIIGIFLFVLFLNWKLAMVFLVYSVIWLWVELRYDSKMARLSDQFADMNQVAGGLYVEGVGNMLALKALGSERRANTKIKTTEGQARELAIMKENVNFQKWKYTRFIDGFGFVILFLFIGRELLAGAISVGSILVFFSYFVKTQQVLADVGTVNEGIIDARSALGNMMPIFWEKTHVMTGKEKFPADWKAIKISKGTLAYPSGQVGLTRFNLVIGRGEKLGIAGSSGGGKSTLVKLLLGLYKLQSGDFIVGNRNYYDIAHEDLIHQLSVVLQETELFNISLRENITMMREEDPELLQKAIEISQLSDVIAKLPEGVDTLIGERGYMLSGGERQRLGIARAIYKNSEIMIFDEATSSLDSETERKIMEGLLGDFGKSRTMIIVAHRLSTLANTDRVAVFEEGTIVEEGTYHDLLANEESILSKLSKTQTTHE